MEEKKIQDGVIRRLFESPCIRKVDTEARTVEFVASDNSVDSYKTVLPVDKWDLSRYSVNGAVGYMHDVYGDSWTKAADPDDIIGKGVAFVEDEQLIVRITFEPADLNAKADKIFRKIQFGSLNAVSVGFSPTKKGHMGDVERGEQEGVYYYNGQELLEVSVVNIPANKNAIKRFFGTDVEDIEAQREAESKARQLAEEEARKAAEKEKEITDTVSDDHTNLIIAKARRALVQTQAK